MERPAYWESVPRNDERSSVIHSYSNLYSDGHVNWVIVNINREGGLMIAENPINRHLSIWAAEDVGVALGIVSGRDQSRSTHKSWLLVAFVQNELLPFTNGAAGAHFDALVDLHNDRRIGVDVWVECSDASPAILRIDAYVQPGEVTVSTKWEIDPCRAHDPQMVITAAEPLLDKIKAQALEIKNFLAVSGILVSYDNPRGYARMDFWWYSIDAAQPSILQALTYDGAPCALDGSLNQSTSTSPDTASSICGDEAGKKRYYSQVEGMSTGARLRGRRPGSQDTKPRNRGSHLSKKDKIDVMETIAKLVILEKSDCDKPFDPRDPRNQHIGALFTLTKVFEMWYSNKKSTLYSKRIQELLEMVSPLLRATTLLLKELSPEFCASVKDEKTLEIYTELRRRFSVWYANNCKNDFFASDACEDTKSTCGSPDDSDWLQNNRSYLLERGVQKLRRINNAEIEKRQVVKLANDAVDFDVKASLVGLRERLAFAQDNIVREIKTRRQHEGVEAQVCATYNQFEAVINKAVDFVQETNELTERLKILEQKRQELVKLCSSTSEKSADFTHEYISQASYSPEQDVQSVVEKILSDASRILATAPQFYCAGGDGRDIAVVSTPI